MSNKVARTYDKHFRERFENIIEICDELSNEKLKSMITDAYMKYNLRMMHAHNDAHYFDIVESDNYDGIIQLVARQLIQLNNAYLSRIGSYIDRTVIECTSDYTSFYCKVCGSSMYISETNEIICDTCGIMLKPTCLLMREQMCIQDSSKVNYNNYVRHLKIWLDRLQAIEKYIFCADDIQKLKASIISECYDPDSFDWQSVSYEDVLRHLTLCKLTKLSAHVPKLMKEIGARAPPILDYDTLQIIKRDFIHIMDIYSSLYHDQGNKPYYAFFIAKIIKHRFNGTDTMRMLQYISKQERVTIIKNDNIYKKICLASPSEYDLIYSPENI